MTHVEDTYAEAFRSLYAEVLVTARNHKWLEHAANAATGHASSTIMCDCEAGVDRYLNEDETPDGRPGVALQFMCRGFARTACRHWRSRCWRGSVKTC